MKVAAAAISTATAVASATAAMRFSNETAPSRRPVAWLIIKVSLPGTRA